MKNNFRLAAVFLIQYPKRLKKYGILDEWLNENQLEEVLKSYADGKIPKDSLLTTLRTVAELGAFTKEILPDQASETEISDTIKDARVEFDKMDVFNRQNGTALLMGMIMKKLRGKVPAKNIAEKIGFTKGAIKQ